MFEPTEFKKLGDLPPETLAKLLAEINGPQAIWTDYASFKLASRERRTLILKRFPAPPVKTDVVGNKTYHAPAAWENQCVLTQNWHNLPITRGVIEYIMRARGWTKLGIALVSELKPGGSVPTHSDDGEYFDLFHRVHIQLVGNHNSKFTIGDVTKVLNPGEIWLIDDRRKHSVVNEDVADGTNMDRLNLYFDAK